MIAPRVHLNGDRKETLVEQLSDAYSAIGSAMHALQQAAPNARNYYVIGPKAYTQAVAEHEARGMKLRDVQKELEAMVEAIEEGRTEFTEEDLHL